MFDTAAMNQLAARVRAQREAKGLGLNVRFTREDGTPDEYSFATPERADRFRANVAKRGLEVRS